MNTSLSRRRFIHTGAAALAGAALAPQLATAAAGKKRNIQKALKYHMITGKASVMDKFKLIKKVGFDGVEFRGPLTWKGKTTEDIKDVLKAQDATGIQVPGMVAGAHGRNFSHADPKVRAEAVEGYKAALREVKTLGGTTVLLYPGKVDKANSYTDVYQRMQESIAKVTPTCEETGVRVAIENVWNNFLLSPMEAARFVDECDHPMVGWYFDVGNVVTNGWPEQWVRTLAHRIFKLDIKEFSRAKRDKEGMYQGFRVNLMEGDCDWPAVMRALDEIGHTEGWGSAEVKGGDEERLRFISERMDKIFAL